MSPDNVGQVEAGGLAVKSAVWIDKLFVGIVGSKQGGELKGWGLVQEGPGQKRVKEPDLTVKPPEITSPPLPNRPSVLKPEPDPHQPDKPPFVPTPEPKPPAPPVAPIPELLPQPEKIPPVEEVPTETLTRRNHRPPFLVENLYNPAGEVIIKAVKEGMEKNSDRYPLKKEIEKITSFTNGDEVKKLVPQKPDESDLNYQTRVLEQVMNRLRFQGDYESANDALFEEMRGKLPRDMFDRLLMGAEAKYYINLEKINEGILADDKDYLSQSEFVIATQVGEGRGVFDVSGGQLIFKTVVNEHGEKHILNERELMANRDLVSSAILCDALMNEVPYEKTPGGSSLTFSQKIEQLEVIRQNRLLTPEQRRQATLEIRKVQKDFYAKVYEALHKRRSPTNQFDANLELFQHGAFEFVARLKDIGSNPKLLEGLVDGYAVRHKFTPEKKQQFLDRLKVMYTIKTPNDQLANFFNYAQKGTEYMERKMERNLRPKPELHKIPKRIRTKIFTEAGPYVDVPHDYEGETPAANTAPTPPEPAPKNPDGQDGENLPTAPVPGEGQPGGEPNPAPVTTPPETATPPALKTDYGLGIVSDPTRIEQEIGGLAQHDRSRKEPAKNTGLVGVLRGLVSPIITPRVFIRNFVQNTLFKKTFDARSMGFSRSMMEIARTQHASLDSSIPFEMPQEILDTAVEEGRKIRKADNVLKRLGWTLADTVSGLTGFYENSDMRYAEKWFKENGKALVDSAKKTSLGEQTELGQRFALKADNKDVISSQVGETRYKIDDVISDQPARDALQLKIKEIVALYAQNRINDEELLKQFNAYYHKEVLPKVAVDKQKELTGVELSSNILRIAQEMKIEDRVAVGENKTRYQRYQDEKADDGETMWSKLHFDIYLGKGKYEVSRGEVRLSGLEKSLIHRMVERNYKMSNDLIASSAVEMAKDIVVYGGAYVAGGSGAAMMFGRSFFHVGGMLVTPIVAGAREGVLVSNKGKLYGLRGKAVSDFEQITRETASGRKSKSDAKLRPMFEKAMVDQRKATELTGAIDVLLQKGTLSEGEQRQLLQALAHAKARLTLTDLSTKKGKTLFDTVGEISVAQNFIGFSADNNNAEMTALRTKIVQGVAKLAADNPGLYAKLNDCQAVYEAQLRVGSFEDKVITALARDMKITQGEARTRFASFYEGLGIDNKDRKSLEASSKTLAGLVRRKAATTAAFAFVVSPIIGTEMRIIGEAATGLHEIITNHGGEWLDNWRQVVTNGTIPLTYDAHGNLISGLSPLQKDVLSFENLIKPPLGGDHIETIDGVQIVLPGGVEHGFVQGHPGEDALVDVRTGQVLASMDKSHFFYDSNGQMMVKNEVSGLSQPAEVAFAPFARNGVQLIQDPNLNQTTSTPETVFHAGSTTNQGIDLNGDGKTDVNVNVPANSHWVHDPVSGKYDLQTTNTDGSTSNVVEDATINSNGEISGGSYDHSIVQIVNNRVTGPVTGPGSIITHPTDVWSHSTEVGGGGSLGREWFGKLTNDQGYQTRNMLYAWKETQGQDSSLTLDFRRMAGEQYHPENGLTNAPADFIKDFQNSTGQTVGPGEYMGVFIARSGDAHNGVLVVDGNNDGLINFGLNSPDHVMKYDSLTRQYVADSSVSVHDVGASITGNSIFENHADGRVYIEHPDINDHSGLGALSLQDPNHQGFGTIEVVKVGDHMTETYGGSTHPTMDVFATIRGDSPNIPSLIEAPPPPTPTYTSEVTIQDIVHTVDKTILGYRVEYKGETWLPPMIPIPTRENIEKSVRGEPAGQTSTVSTTPSSSTPQPGRSPSSIPTSPRTPSSPSLTPQERKGLEKKRQELEEKKKRIAESIKQAKKTSPDKKSTPEQTKALEDAERELAEVDAQLHPPTPESKEQPKLEKKDYERMKQAGIGIIQSQTLEQINETLRSLNLPEISDQKELDEIRKNPDLIKRKAIEIVLEQIRLRITMDRASVDEKKEWDKIVDEEIKKYPKEDQKIIKDFYNYEIKASELEKRLDQFPSGSQQHEKILDDLDLIDEAKEALTKAHPNLKKQLNSLARKAMDVFYDRYKAEIDAEVDKIKRQIEQWESKLNIPEVETQHYNYYKQFLELKKRREITSATFPSEDKFIWQEVTYGQEIKKSSEKIYRGYLMIEPKDFPKALKVLMSIGNKRKSEGKRLYFKWLIMTAPPKKWLDYLKNKNNFGNYEKLDLTDPRIVIYGDDANEVKEILSALAENPDWEEFERNRVQAAGGRPENAPRRPGTNAFSFKGREWRSLNWNNKTGYSENEAADPDWRNKKVGANSVLVS